MKTEVVRARVPDVLKQDFETAITANGWNLSQAIRQLMHQYVTQEKEKALRRQETLEALEDIEAGHVMAGEKILDWLGNWGTNAEQAPPK